MSEIEKYNIIIGLSEESFLNKMIETNKEYKIHLEIETGMNRTGININDLERYISKIKQSKIIIEGIYSHLSSADYDKEYTEKQIGIFKQALSIIKNNGLTTLLYIYKTHPKTLQIFCFFLQSSKSTHQQQFLTKIQSFMPDLKV